MDKDQFQKYKQLGMGFAFFFFVVDIYYNYLEYFISINYKHPLVFSILKVIRNTGLLNHPVYIKIAIIILLFLFVLLDTGRKDSKMDKNVAIQYAVMATVLFLSTAFVIPFLNVFFYCLFVLASVLFIVVSFNNLHRLLPTNVMSDRLNKVNKTFEQTQELIENELSVNIPYQYVKEYKITNRNKREIMEPVLEQGYINFIAPDRASIIFGKPGSGKSYSFNEEFIRQFIMKGFSFVNYDFKFPTLTNIAYNYYMRYKDDEGSYAKYPKATFATINIDDPRYSERCNPLAVNILTTKAQAIDAVYTIFYNIDKKSATSQDFFQMSAMAITSASLWFLRTYKEGKYCSFPHLIEFIQNPDEKILKILDYYPDLRYFTSSFSDALSKKSFEQLSGQTASARIPLGKCATPEMFYVMTDPDNTGVDLRVNRKENVTVLNLANNPETQKTNAPAIGLYMSQASKLINAQQRVPCCFHVDELPTIFINGLNTLIATGRSNKVCTVLAVQDYSQLVQEYGKEIAETIYSTIGNVVSGAVSNETAERIAKNVGKMNYQTQSISINNESTSTSFNTNREYMIPPEDITQFSQGEFVGILVDTFKQPLPHKVFRGMVSPSKSDLGSLEVPMLHPEIDAQYLFDYQKKIQDEVRELIEDECERINLENYEKANEALEKDQENLQAQYQQDTQDATFGEEDQPEESVEPYTEPIPPIEAIPPMEEFPPIDTFSDSGMDFENQTMYYKQMQEPVQSNENETQLNQGFISAILKNAKPIELDNVEPEELE
ncbi:type IV secretory pathway TraG/TraD family ATPase VirD4 [Flavobacterium croceum DSM 17960]|uniref:Type IV secretory pathway TraG/TraD family ATPase VirD4 n=1 Tax=Flavobacterium croceum DSM 17960 TaxID=1121886 RepID=A0A2S4N5B6_9FLAO|nr:TraM recognition domain-containing protein [Flavobacterium croceum]POS00917.1 type IV secretory pathway TraG/TraD family ATPase VirD4 [Flavobacterium croceum DSM 17960]